MGFSTDYLYYFHYSGSIGYLIFCCHSVATRALQNADNLVKNIVDGIKYDICFFLIQKLVHRPPKYHKYVVKYLESLVYPILLLHSQYTKASCFL